MAVLKILKICPTNKTHLFVEGYATVRGKRQNFSAHYFLWNDGKFHMGKETEQPFYQRHHNCYFGIEGATEAFKKAVFEILDAEVTVWVSNNWQQINEAEEKYKQDCIQKRKDLVEKHRKAILAIEEEIKEILLGKHLPSHTEVEV